MYEMNGIHDQPRSDAWYERWEEINGQPHPDLDEEEPARPRRLWRFLLPRRDYGEMNNK